jgi:hypothetical protein
MPGCYAANTPRACRCMESIYNNTHHDSDNPQPPPSCSQTRGGGIYDDAWPCSQMRGGCIRQHTPQLRQPLAPTLTLANAYGVNIRQCLAVLTNAWRVYTTMHTATLTTPSPHPHAHKCVGEYTTTPGHTRKCMEGVDDNAHRDSDNCAPKCIGMYNNAQPPCHQHLPPATPTAPRARKCMGGV